MLHVLFANSIPTVYSSFQTDWCILWTWIEILLKVQIKGWI